jgi:hypothetical protein
MRARAQPIWCRAGGRARPPQIYIYGTWSTVRSAPAAAAVALAADLGALGSPRMRATGAEVQAGALQPGRLQQFVDSFHARGCEFQPWRMMTGCVW